MIDIVVVNWNAGELLEQCLSSIDINSDGQVSSIIVVDNGSKDGSAKCVQAHSAVRLIKAEENLGFGVACNIGAKFGSAKFVLFLNPDARILPGTLTKTVEFMNGQNASKIGICGVQLLDNDFKVSRTCSRLPSVKNISSASIGLDRIIPHWGMRMAEWDHADSRKVGQVMGAYFLIRRDLFEHLHGFDERFFVYFEEVDLSNRCAGEGWASWFLADAQAIHYGGGSSEKVKARRLFYSLRSRLQYARKHFGPIECALVFWATLLIEPLARLGQCLGRGKINEAGQVLNGYGMLVSWLICGRPTR